jgi:hypothetical protein
MTKTRDGTGKENRKVKPRLYGNGTKRDPLELYKIYSERRPEKAMNPDSPFYLTCIPWTRIDSGIWYFPRPTEQNTLGNIMPMAAEECGMDRKTNHSVRKTTIKTLRKAGVARDKIKHVTGHKSATSIEAYDDVLSDDEQCDYSDVLTGAKSSIVPVTKQSNELVSKKSSTITKEPNIGTNNFNTAISTPSVQPASIMSEKPKTSNPLSNLNDLFGQGSVLNNCTFNKFYINFNVPTMSQPSCDYNPPRKYRKLLPIDSSDNSQD